MTRKSPQKEESSANKILALSKEGIQIAKKAKKHGLRLTSDNFYAHKLVTLQADASNTLKALGANPKAQEVKDKVNIILSPSITLEQKTQALKEVSFLLNTEFQETVQIREDDGLFPLGILVATHRKYLIDLGKQMNGCYNCGWYDAAAVMMRRLLEISIIEAFEVNGISQKIKGKDQNYLHLTELVRLASIETTWNLSRNAKKDLPSLKDIGHFSAHGRYFTAQKQDVDLIRPACRIIIEEFLHHAKLL